MEQRPLRLGDILDDYCPRERRVTNHAVVAMLDDAVKQTRCTTCDAEHPYKGGKAPRRRTKAPAGDLALPSVPSATVTAPVIPPVTPSAADADSDIPQPPQSQPPARSPEVAEPGLAAEPMVAADDAGAADDPGYDEGPVHRRLIRATLPRPEGQKEARALPDFTVRQPTGGRNGNTRDNGHFRGGDNRGNQARGADRGHRFGARNGQGGRPGQSRGQNSGFRSSQPPQQRRSGRKRSR
jgi:hypothetical protein